MSGLAWGVGIAAAGAMFSSWNWNSGGSGSYVNVNANRATNIDRNYNRGNVGTSGRWQHDASHRKGVAYRDPAARQQYGQNRPGADQRQQFRGQTNQAARPGGAGGPGGAGRPGVSEVPVVPAAWVGPGAPAGPGALAVPVVLVASAVPVAPGGPVAEPAAETPSGRRWWWWRKWPLRSQPWPASEPRVPARPGPAAKGGAAAQRRRRRRRGGGGGGGAAWWRRRRTAMSKLIRRIFLALTLSTGLAAAALGQALPQLRGFPTAGGSG